MEEKTHPTKWQKYAKGKKPSMKRRSNFKDYCSRGIYMITIAMEGRRPLLGHLSGEKAEEAHVELSEFGRKVKECWMDIPKYYPQIEVVKLCIMPDHIHGILFVHEKIERHLGHVINGFKAGCRKAAREMGIITAAMPQSTKRKDEITSPVKYTAASPQSPLQAAQQASPQAPPQSPQAPPDYDRHHGLIWEKNYNDRILTGKGQYERMKAYLDDNPRRLLIKHLHPEYFTQFGNIIVGGIPMQAMGNRFLLDNPVKIQIQCSRRMTAEEIEHYKNDILLRAKSEGAIVVSPCISPGEQQIATAAMGATIPLIVLLLNGIPPLFKPQPRYLKACTQGLLLMLAPFTYQNEKIDNMRQRCIKLNDIAADICKDD